MSRWERRARGSETDQGSESNVQLFPPRRGFEGDAMSSLLFWKSRREDLSGHESHNEFVIDM
jgi:hypothetical protein